jgi:hypothetical protein
MEKTAENGIVYSPYGFVGYWQRVQPEHTAVRCGWLRWIMRLFGV